MILANFHSFVAQCATQLPSCAASVQLNREATERLTAVDADVVTDEVTDKSRMSQAEKDVNV